MDAAKKRAEKEAQLTFALLYGPVVQFAKNPGQNEPSVVALPQQLALSVDVVFHHPADANLPDNLSHFCFAPLQRLQEPSDLSFCLTDSNGESLYGVSLQMLCPFGSSGGSTATSIKHRPMALCVLSSRPLYQGLLRLLRSILPLAQKVMRMPVQRRTSELRVRVTKDQHGLGLVMSPNNTIMQVEPGSMAAKERRLRQGDVIIGLDGNPLNGMRLSEALKRLREEAEAAEAAAPAAAPEASEPPPGGSRRGGGTKVYWLTVTRYYLLLTAYCLLLTTYYLLLATYYSLLTARYSLLATHYSLLATHYWLLTTYYSLLTSH